MKTSLQRRDFQIRYSSGPPDFVPENCKLSSAIGAYFQPLGINQSQQKQPGCFESPSDSSNNWKAGFHA